ncbi:MAG: oligoendopeptidase, partial [Actinomycetota bacterium]|nr:oligoendopeptidase [Actinomycetota bacterium]
MTSTDLTADDVIWDLAPLLPAPGDAGIEELIAAADAKADELAAFHGRIAALDADGLVAFMQGLAEVHELIGRVGSFVSLDFSTDTVDPVRGARMQKVDEQSAVIGTKLLFFELEWAELDDDKVESLLADPRLDFASHYLRSARRYRPHLLSEPEEVVLTEKSVTGSSAWQRLFDEQISAITVELDGETTTLEAGLSQLQGPDREVRKAAAEAVTAGLAPGL